MMAPLEAIPIPASKESARFDLYNTILGAISDAGEELKGGDILVLSSKYVSVSLGRVVQMSDVVASQDAVELSRAYRLDERTAEMILRESDQILGGMYGFILASIGGIIAPNAGIDRSNAEDDTLILYPDDAGGVAEELRRKIFMGMSIHTGVIISDSRLMPARVGTTGVAIACAGMEPVMDMRSEPDLNGVPLKVTRQATADSLASIANHTMGEGAESIPIVIIRNSGARLTDRRVGIREMTVPYEQCVYIRSRMFIREI